MTKEDILARIPERWGKYLSVSRGWYEIVFALDRDIAALDPDYTIAQVKEKFGGLRYYIDNIKPEFYDKVQILVGEAEIKAATICEECGQPGVLRKDIGWMKTLCGTHHKAVQSRKS